MKKILVTGATGFIGNYVIEELLKEGVAVTATSFSAEEAKSLHWYDKVTYIPFDLRNLASGGNYFNFFGQPDMLIHLAWEGLPNYKSAFHLEENLPRHQAFLRNMIEHGLTDISVTGTCFEYGMQEGMLAEDKPALPSNAYAQAKDGLRSFLELLQQDFSFNLKWIRLFYMYGKGRSSNSLISQLEKALENGATSFNMSPGDQLRDYLPVEKVAEYIVRIASQKKITGIINCCSGNPIMVKKLVEDYLHEKNVHITLNLGYYPYNDVEPRNFWGDPGRLKKILNNE